ncbi:MAG: SBBP repeat-containing protein [Fimbriimonadaceae bacterium]
MRKVNTIAFILTAAAGALAQQQSWVARYANPTGGWNVPAAVKISASGITAVVGTTRNKAGTSDIATVLYDRKGNQLWADVYNGPGGGEDYGVDAAFDHLGNLYVAGSSDGGTGTDMDYVVIKYSPSGARTWIARYNGPANSSELVKALAVDSGGNAIVTGRSSTGANSQDWDIATIKLNPFGARQWTARYGHAALQADEATDVAVDAAGNAYVVGTADTGVNSDIVTIKYSPLGAQQWLHLYGNEIAGADIPAKMVVDSAGSVYVCGSTWSNEVATLRFLAYKLTPGGTLDWAYQRASISRATASALALDKDGNLLVGGQVGDTAKTDLFIAKLNSSGVEQWAQTYDGGDLRDDETVDIACDSSGNTYLAGRSRGSTTAWDYALLSFSGTGDRLWTRRYNGPSSSSMDEAVAMALGPKGMIVLTGSSPNATRNTDFATVAFTALVRSGPP